MREADEAAVASPAEIIVALISYNDERTVGAVGRAVREGLDRHFAATPARILLADAGSSDGTRDAVRDAVGDLIELDCSVSTGFGEMPYHGHPNRARALHAVFEAIRARQARACVVIDASLSSFEPGIIERLVEPVLGDGFDYVSPHYKRRVNEGALTKGIVYPMFRSLYGARLRQPAATEFGCSARLASFCLDQEFWDADPATANVGIDLWIASAAVCGEFRLCEVALGPRGLSGREMQADLSTTLAQVIGGLFVDLEQRVDSWQRVRSSVPVPMLGVLDESEPDRASPNIDELLESFRLGYRELREIWTWILPPRTIVLLRQLTESPRARFRIDDRFWATIIYDFAIAHNQHVMPQDHLLRSLTPLYTGWLASFVLEMGNATANEADVRVDRVCAAFEAEKRYLISRWRWPERLR